MSGSHETAQCTGAVARTVKRRKTDSETGEGQFPACADGAFLLHGARKSAGRRARARPTMSGSHETAQCTGAVARAVKRRKTDSETEEGHFPACADGAFLLHGAPKSAGRRARARPSMSGLHETARCTGAVARAVNRRKTDSETGEG